MAFILTWKPTSSTGQPGRSEVEILAQHFLDSDEPIDGNWSTRRRYGYEEGDRVYLVAVGTPERGIVASGTVADPEVWDGPHWENPGETAHYIDVSWDIAVFQDESLPVSVLNEIAPNTKWTPQSNGTEVRDGHDLVEHAWQAHLASLGLDTAASESTLTPADPADDIVEVPRGYTTTRRRARRHQKRFRKLLLKHYDHQCFYCGLDIVEILEAAHIVPDRDGGAASTKNGRLLCANHHRAFDAGLLLWSGVEFYPADDAPDVLPDPQ